MEANEVEALVVKHEAQIKQLMEHVGLAEPEPETTPEVSPQSESEMAKLFEEFKSFLAAGKGSSETQPSEPPTA